MDFHDLTPQEAVLFAMREGEGPFRTLIRIRNAAWQLGASEDDILGDFALWLLEKNAGPVFAYEGKAGASFRTYITVVFRNWLGRKLQRDARSDEELLTDAPENFAASLASGAGSNTLLLDALYACIALLDQTGKKLILLVIKAGKIALVARQTKQNQKTLYNQYYVILKVLKNCLESKGFGSEEVHE